MHEKIGKMLPTLGHVWWSICNKSPKTHFPRPLWRFCIFYTLVAYDTILTVNACLHKKTCDCWDVELTRRAFVDFRRWFPLWKKLSSSFPNVSSSSNSSWRPKIQQTCSGAATKWRVLAKGALVNDEFRAKYSVLMFVFSIFVFLFVFLPISWVSFSVESFSFLPRFFEVTTDWLKIPTLQIVLMLFCLG